MLTSDAHMLQVDFDRAVSHLGAARSLLVRGVGHIDRGDRWLLRRADAEALDKI